MQISMCSRPDELGAGPLHDIPRLAGNPACVFILTLCDSSISGVHSTNHVAQ